MANCLLSSLLCAEDNDSSALFLIFLCKVTSVCFYWLKKNVASLCFDYLTKLRNGNLDMLARQQAVDWIRKVHAHFNFGPLCAYLSINYLDRFFAAYEFPVCESRFVFEAKTIQKMELLVLATLKWRMQTVTPFSFVDAFIGKLVCDQPTSRSLISRSTQLILCLINVAGSRSARQGHEFYGCRLWPRSDCKFFIWKQQVDVMFSDGGNSNILELKNKALEMKIANLEVEKMMLQEENKTLKNKQAFCNVMSTKSYVVVLVTLLFAMYWYFATQ
ncbi:hypothetical protein L1987_07698 [Smallanthus sonchifolius]|uniref:Uncharacterized protein n=1 Tax=Smallanthus sonchifolius TaxID=185202 RepID=A0ACB9K119_9ASTR|nr:hypothetical protein L1987_07698 [Smallanthus sonchifolius]